MTPSPEALKRAEKIVGDPCGCPEARICSEHSLVDRIAAALDEYHKEKTIEEFDEKQQITVPGKPNPNSTKALIAKARAEGRREGMEECVAAHNAGNMGHFYFDKHIKKAQQWAFEEAAKIAENSADGWAKHLRDADGPRLLTGQQYAAKEIRAASLSEQPRGIAGEAEKKETL